MNLLRSTIEMTNRAVGRLKAARLIKTPTEHQSIRVNLGCGLTVSKDWINIDGSLNALAASFPPALHPLAYHLTGAKSYYSKLEYCRLLRDHVFVHHDLSHNIPLATQTVDYIYSSHFLEHLYRRDAIELLHECHRILKVGGILRLSIPDLEYAISLYFTERKDEMLDKYFFVEDDNNHYSRHKYMYDFKMISTLLEEAGFRLIERCRYHEGQVPDIDVLDSRPDESLFLEASK